LKIKQAEETKMKRNHSLSLLFILTMISFNRSIAKFSFETVKNYFSFGKKEVAKIEKEYFLPHDGSIDLKNMDGSVEVCVENGRKTVLVQAEKKARKEEQLQNIRVASRQDGHALSIRTSYIDPDTKGNVDYKLTLPASADITLSLSNSNGPIKVENIHGKLNAKTVRGPITVKQAHNTIVSNVMKSGDIIIEEPNNHVKGSTRRGRIKIIDSKQSVIAHTQNGNIELRAQAVPPRSKIKLVNNYGRINLSLPHEVNSDLLASTKLGTVTCQHDVTLKPRTTTLDSTAWKEFKRSVDGTIGKGQSQIVVHSEQSSIQITKAKPVTA